MLTVKAVKVCQPLDKIEESRVGGLDISKSRDWDWHGCFSSRSESFFFVDFYIQYFLSNRVLKGV